MNEQIYAIMRQYVPGLVNVPDAQLQPWVDMAKLFVCDGKFGDSYNTAVALYALHIMFADGAFKQTNDIADYSKQVASYSLSGEFSITYANASANSSNLSTTPWGKLYSKLLRKKGGGFGLITSRHSGGCCR
jgi:hypothetical protein